MYVQTLKYGVLVEEVPVVSTTTVTPGVTYDVVIPPGALTTETTTTTPARLPEVGILDVTVTTTVSIGETSSASSTSDEVFAKYFLGDDSLTVTHETGFPLTTTTSTLPASRWVVAQRVAGGYDIFVVGSTTERLRDASNIIYKGTTYATPQAL